MGRLTADQKAALAAGQPVRQTWVLHVPRASGGATLDAVTIETGLFYTNASAERRVVRAGRTTFRVFNPHPQVQPQGKAPRYSFVVRNNDGKFHAGHVDSFFYNTTGTYQAKPQECYVTKYLFVLLLDGTWDEVEHLRFYGQILSVRYTVGTDEKKDPVGGTAIINTEQVGAWEALRRAWNTGDGTDVAVDSSGYPGGYNFDWTV